MYWAYRPTMESLDGEAVGRLVKDISPQETHRCGRRTVLRAAALGIAAAGPVFWRQSAALGSVTPPALPPPRPRWLSLGPDPASQMYVSWSAGTAGGGPSGPFRPRIRFGLDATYGSVREPGSSEQVPLPSMDGGYAQYGNLWLVGGRPQVPDPSMVSGYPAEDTFYSSALLAGLRPGTTYHYSVTNEGKTWTPDATFTTAAAGRPDFRFTAFGDQAASPFTAAPMVQLVSALGPAFHLVAGDLAYATPNGLDIPDITGFDPGQWDKYLRMISGNGAQSIPWQASVGAHEVEPLDDHGYAGFVTRLPQCYDLTSGSPVVHTFTYGNVAFVHLDGNDLSAQETINNGYTAGAQTVWLRRTLAGYRSSGSGIDFIVVVCNCCCYSSNTQHGSDGGLRDVWGPLFDRYQVDLVLSGHVHAYERTNPMRGGQPTRKVARGGTVSPHADGTIYICAGGGGNGLFRSWYGTTDSGDAGSPTAPKVWRWSGGGTARGGSGTPEDVTDAARGYSAVRRAVFSCILVDVTAPRAPGGSTSMYIRALMPSQTRIAVTSVTRPATIDSVTLTRNSQA